MIRRLTLLCSLALLFAACDKPTQVDCDKALRNIQKLLGTENIITPAQLQSEVRRCTAASSKKVVACAIAAHSLDDLNKCDFEKTGKHHFTTTGSAAGSAGLAGSAGSAGSAAAGTDTVDSPTPPPAAAGAAPGSATSDAATR